MLRHRTSSSTRQLAEAEGLSIGSVVRLATTADGRGCDSVPDRRHLRADAGSVAARHCPARGPTAPARSARPDPPVRHPCQAPNTSKRSTSRSATRARRPASRASSRTRMPGVTAAERGRGHRRRRVPRARAISPRDRRRHDRRRNRVPPRADDHARGRAPRDRRRAAPHRPARAPHPGADPPRGRADRQRRGRCSGSRSPARRRSSSTGSSSGATTRR